MKVIFNSIVNDTLAQQWKAVKYNPIQELADQNWGAISDGEYRIKSALNEKYIISTGDGNSGFLPVPSGILNAQNIP